jgi:hypothetical protein
MTQLQATAPVCKLKVPRVTKSLHGEDLEVIVGRTNTDRPTRIMNEATDERTLTDQRES